MKHVRGLKHGAVLVALALTSGLLVLVVGATPSVAANCGCVGDFVAPKTAPAKITAAANNATSPGGGKYKLEVQGGATGGTLRITRADGTGTAYTIEIDSQTNGWGFAPDGERFLTYGAQTQLHDLAARRVLLTLDNNATVGFSANGAWALARWVEGNQPVARLYNATNGQIRNLGGSDRIQNPDVIGFSPDSASLLVATNSSTHVYAVSSGVLVHSRSGAPAGAFFSPDSKHVVMVVLAGTQAELQLVATSNGATVHTASFSASTAPVVSEGWDKAKPQSSGGFGFSPDGASFVVAANEGSATLRVIDLASRSEVVSRNFSGGAGWAFGPCGDVIAIVTGSGSSMTVTLSSTRAKQQVSTTTMPAGSLELKATADNFVADLSGGERVLAPNLACASVAFALPGQVMGGSTVEQQFSLDRPAPIGGLVVELSSSSTALTVPGTISFSAGSTTTTANLSSKAVTQDTPVTVTATSKRGGSVTTVTSSTTVRAAAITSVAVADDELYAGESTTLTVTMADAAPTGGLQVSLRSDDPAVAIAETVTVKQGQTEATAQITTSAVDDEREVTITATYAAQSKKATLTLRPRVATTATALAEPSTVPLGEEVSVFVEIVATDPDTAPYQAPSGRVQLLHDDRVLDQSDLDDVDAETPTGSVALAATDVPAGSHDLVVRYLGDGPHQPSQTIVRVDVVDGPQWTGSGDGSSWSDPDNWDTRAVPASGDHIFIRTDSKTELVNDVAGLSLASLQLSGVVLTGQELAVSSMQLARATIGTDLRLDDDLHITTASHSQIRGQLRGSGALEVDATLQWIEGRLRPGGSVLTLSGANTWSGRTTIAGSGAVKLAHAQALGSTAGPTELRGRLCLDHGVRSAEPIISSGGTLSGCSFDDVDDEDWPRTPVLSGPVEVTSGLKVFCAPLGDERHRYDADGDWTHLEISGAISGPGSVTICAGRLALTGDEANTWTGGTTMPMEDLGDYYPRTDLVLAKSDQVVSLPGRTVGDTVTVAADGQIAAQARLDLHTLDLGTHSSAAGSLRLSQDGIPEWFVRSPERGLLVGIDGATAGSIAVSGTVELYEQMAVRVGADAGHGERFTVVTGGAGVAGCPDDPLAATLSGSDRIDYKVHCGAQKVELRAVWHTHLEISSDPEVIAERPTITVRVVSPEGAPAAHDGQMVLRDVYYQWNNWQVNTDDSVAETEVRSGQATYPSMSLGPYSTVAGFYDGGSQYGAASSELIRLWHPDAGTQAPAKPAAPEVWFDVPGDNAVELRWTSSGALAAYRLNVYGSDGSTRHITTNVTYPEYGWRISGAAVNNWDLFNLQRFRTIRDLDPEVTYTFTLQLINRGGWSAESEPLEWREAPGSPADVPGAPTAVRAAVDGSSVTVQWEAPEEDGGAELTNYVLEVHPAGGDSWQVVTQDPTTEQVLDLEPGKYAFTVRAENRAGLGPVSEQSAVVTVSEPTPEPTDDPTPEPTDDPTPEPTDQPTEKPAAQPTAGPDSPKTRAGGRPDDATPGTPQAGAPAPTTPVRQPDSDDDTGSPGTSPSDPDAPSGQIDRTSAAAGSQVEIEAAGFLPDEHVRIELHSEPTLIGTVVADDAGRVRTQVTIPSQVEPGDHTLYLRGLESGVKVEIPVTVTASPEDSSGGLAWLVIGMACLVAVLGVAGLRTRRTSRARG